MDKKQKTKFIRTAGGYKTIKEIKEEFTINDSSFPLTTLPYEHVIHDITKYLKPMKEIIDPKEKIELSNYSILLKNPFLIYQNLYFDADSSEISNELEKIKKHNCCLICDITNEKFGQNKRILKEIQKICHINICFGQSLDYIKAKNNIKKYSNELQYLIVYGDDNEPNDQKLIPSFIGEEIVSEFKEQSEQADLYKMIIEDLINKYEIPFFVKLENNQKYINTNTIIDFFNKNNVQNKKKIVFILGLADYEENKYESEIKLLVEKILSCGYSIILTIYECDHSIIDNKSKELDIYFNKAKACFLNTLLKNNNKNIKQIMLSNNINYRVHLKKFGGFGYNNLFENYFSFIFDGLNKEEINFVMSENILEILNYWESIEKFKKSVKMIKCENCRKEKEENDKDLFSKYDKNFCSFGCLKQWLKNNPQ